MSKERPFFLYSEESLNEAVQDAIANKNIRDAARKYGVPYSTLNRHVNENKDVDKPLIVRKMGPATILTTAEEEILDGWISNCALRGFPITRPTLCETVKEMLDEDGRPNPFPDNLPGKTWFYNFLKRHPEIKQRHAEGINKARANVTENDLRNWHAGLRAFLEKEGHADILEDPTRIINADESGFALCPKTGRVLAPRKIKNLYEVKTGNEKENITVLITMTATGALLPPTILYPYERISGEIARNANPTWCLARSKSGWMTGPAFYGFVANSLVQYLKEKKVKLPVLFLIDGHRSHLTLNVSLLCREKGIILYSLYPNSTHITQPADVSFFKPLKSNWKKIVYEWKRTSGFKCVTRVLFANLLESALSALNDTVVKNGFKRCGIYPFNVEEIDFTKCMNDKSRSGMPGIGKDKPLKMKDFLFIESLFGPGRVLEFRKSGPVWEGDESARELFLVWKKMKEIVCSEDLVEKEIGCSEEIEHSDETERPDATKRSDNRTEITEKREKSRTGIFEEEEDDEYEEEFEIIESEYDDEEPHIAVRLRYEGEDGGDSEKEDLNEYEHEGESGDDTDDDLDENEPEISESIASESQNNTESRHENSPKPSTSRCLLKTFSEANPNFVSPALGNCLIWPGEPASSRKPKRKPKIILPHAITSLDWIGIHEGIQREKEIEEENKKKRELERQQKKEETEALKKKKEEEAALKKQKAEELKKEKLEEARRKKEEAAQRKKEKEEAAQKKKEEAAQRKKEKAEAAQKRKEEAQVLKRKSRTTDNEEKIKKARKD